MGSIPLVALAVKPQQPDSLPEVEAKGNQAVLGQQQIQQNQMQLRMQQQQMRDQQVIMQTLGKYNGDVNAALPELSRSISPQSYMNLAKANLEAQKAHAELSKTQLELKSSQMDQLGGLVQQAKSLPPDQYAQAWPQIAQQAQKIMPELAGHIDPNQPMPQQSLDQIALGFMTEKQYIARAAEQRAQQEAQDKHASAAATLPGQVAESNMKQEESQIPFQQRKQIGNLEWQSATDWLAKNPGKTLSDYTIAMKKVVPQFQFNLQNSAAKLSDPALDNAAEQYWNTGKLPPVGRGAAGQSRISAIMNRAAELHQGESITEGSAAYKANSESLKKLQTNYDQVSAFENTALKNLDLVAQKAANVPDLGVRFANVPIRMINEKMIGTKEMAEFRTALQTAQTESAKVLNSANANGVLSDNARHELEDLLNGNMTYSAMMGAINTLKQDMHNRDISYQQQISDIKGRIGGKQQNQQNQQTQQQVGAPFTINLPSGKSITIK